MNRIFVFGSNREGRHGKGAALEAMKNWGACYGQAVGLQQGPAGRFGQSYAIITKELRRHLQPVTLTEVKRGVDDFLEFARAYPSHEFIVTPIGCGLAGFNPSQIKPFFEGAPENVKLPPEFS